MITDYDGTAVFDAEGNKIGHVERTYIDDSRTSRFVEVKLGTLFAKHRLVPLDQAQPERDGLHVPLSKEDIERSPDVADLGDGVDAGTLSLVQAYYTETDGSSPGTVADTAAAGTEDSEDVDGTDVPRAVAGSATGADVTSGDDAAAVPVGSNDNVVSDETNTDQVDTNDGEGLGSRLGHAISNLGAHVTGNSTEDSSPRSTDPTGGETYREQVRPTPVSAGDNTPAE